MWSLGSIGGGARSRGTWMTPPSLRAGTPSCCSCTMTACLLGAHACCSGQLAYVFDLCSCILACACWFDGWLLLTGAPTCMALSMALCIRVGVTTALLNHTKLQQHCVTCQAIGVAQVEQQGWCALCCRLHAVLRLQQGSIHYLFGQCDRCCAMFVAPWN